jgi:hypothetical protein
MKETMRHFDGRPLFLPRHVNTVPYPLSPHEQALYDAVTAYVATGMEQAESTKNRNVALAMTVLQRRLASSLFAITRSIERRRERLSAERKVAHGAEKLRPSISMPEPSIDDFDESLDELLDEDSDDLVSAASNARTLDELDAEIAQLDDLVTHARAAMLSGPERKLREFNRVIDEQTFRDSAEKILVFTEHRDTLFYLEQKVREWGYTVCTIHGGMKLRDRIAAEKTFHGPAQIMIATDAAGEGINLQFCRVMINWDLPWNPNRLEQRMGRIHRYGQKYEVQIVNLVADTTREGAVLLRLMEKLERMRDLLGRDQVYDVISGIFESGQVRLDGLIREAILNRRSLDDILAEIDFIDSDAARAAARDALGEALATSHIDLTYIDGESRDSRERRLTPEYVERFFVDALRELGGRIESGKDVTWRLEKVPLEVRKTALATNESETVTEQRLVTFRKERAGKDPTAEFLAPAHPLFDAVVELMLARARSALASGAVFYDPQATEPSLVWLLEAAVVNGDGDVVHKRLLALRQRDGSFEPVAPGIILDLPPEDTPGQPLPDLVAIAEPELVIAAASDQYAAEYLAEVAQAQERQAEIMSRALEQSTGDTLERLQVQLDRQLVDSERGKDMRLAIQTTNAEIDALTRTLMARRSAIARRRHLSIQTPHVVGVAALLPAQLPVPNVWTKGGGDQRAIEYAAMDHVISYERKQGRSPVDVSRQGVGHDIRSVGSDGTVRYIEVKGHLSTGPITLYYTEWQTAHRMREEFFIYNVTEVLSVPRLQIIQDPVGKGIQPIEKVITYQIELAQFESAAEEVLL